MSKEFNDALLQARKGEKITKYIPDNKLELYILACINKELPKFVPYPYTKVEEVYCLKAYQKSMEAKE